jgi:hypothetical protein
MVLNTSRKSQLKNADTLTSLFKKSICENLSKIQQEANI